MNNGFKEESDKTRVLVSLESHFDGILRNMAHWPYVVVCYVVRVFLMLAPDVVRVFLM